MKKILSLTLVAVMLCTTLMLTSCDAVMEMLQQYIPGLDSGVRYTVTEAEWMAAINMENYTVVENSNVSLDGETTTLYKYTKDGYYSKSGSKEKFYAFEGDECYLLEKGENGMVGTYAGSAKINRLPTFWISGASLSEFTYDEANHAYVFSEEMEIMEGFTKKVAFEVRFENGVLVNLTVAIGDNFSKYTISDIGTTVVDIPKYTLGE